MDETKTSKEDTIKVVDRRLFTSDGERRETVPEPDDHIDRDDVSDISSRSVGPADAAAPESPGGPGFEHRPLEEPEGVDFTLLINAMAQPVVILLDEVPLADANENQARLEQARLQIDLIDLLRVKCRGNLTVEEERLLDQVLYQLRMLFVSKSKS